MKKSFLFKRDGYYHLQYFNEAEGRVKRVSTKQSKKSDAIRFLTDLHKQLESIPKQKFILLSQFSTEYQNYVQFNLSIKYLNNVRTSFKKLIESLEDVPLSKINSYQMEQFISKTYAESKYAAKHHYNNLKNAFNKSIHWGYLTQNPLLKIKSLKVPQNNPSFIDETELEQILSKEANVTLQNIYLFAFYTSMRLGEIVNLKWNQVNLNERAIRVMNTVDFTTKGQRERIVPMADKIFNLLTEIFPKVIDIQKEGYLFTKNGFKFNLDYVSKNFKKSVKEAAKDKTIDSSIHCHDLGHNFASNLARKGVSLLVVKDLLGHTDTKTTMIYAHLQPENLRNAVELLNSEKAAVLFCRFNCNGVY